MNEWMSEANYAIVFYFIICIQSLHFKQLKMFEEGNWYNDYDGNDDNGDVERDTVLHRVNCFRLRLWN